MINEFELSEKFTEIFIDDETVEYFNKWNEKRVKEHDKRT